MFSTDLRDLSAPPLDDSDLTVGSLPSSKSDGLSSAVILNAFDAFSVADMPVAFSLGHRDADAACLATRSAVASALADGRGDSPVDNGVLLRPSVGSGAPRVSVLCEDPFSVASGLAGGVRMGCSRVGDITAASVPRTDVLSSGGPPFRLWASIGVLWLASASVVISSEVTGVVDLGPASLDIGGVAWRELGS